jgi:hypothetical protein
LQRDFSRTIARQPVGRPAPLGRPCCLYICSRPGPFEEEARLAFEEASGQWPGNRQAGLADDASPEASTHAGAASLLRIPRRLGSVGQRRCVRITIP